MEDAIARKWQKKAQRSHELRKKRQSAFMCLLASAVFLLFPLGNLGLPGDPNSTQRAWRCYCLTVCQSALCSWAKLPRETVKGERLASARGFPMLLAPWFGARRGPRGEGWARKWLSQRGPGAKRGGRAEAANVPFKATPPAASLPPFLLPCPPRKGHAISQEHQGQLHT